MHPLLDETALERVRIAQGGLGLWDREAKTPRRAFAFAVVPLERSRIRAV